MRKRSLLSIVALLMGVQILAAQNYDESKWAPIAYHSYWQQRTVKNNHSKTMGKIPSSGDSETF